MIQEMINKVAATDKEIADAITAEYERQFDGLELIASENVVSEAVMCAMGSVLTNKYAEGYPGKRYYGGCACVDVAENIAIERAKKLFGVNYVNVQPHSGAQANTAVYFALLQPGDTVMGMSLAHGGHLTHGSPVNISGMYYNFIPYELNSETEMIDLAEFERLAKEHKPKLIVAGASAYPRTIEFEKMAAIAHSVGAYFMVDMAHIAGLVAAGEHPSPVPYADVVTTTTHKTLRGPRGGMIMTNDEELAKKFNKAIFPGTQGGPLMHTIAAKAVCFGEALTPEFKAYQHQVVLNARALAEGLLAEGFNLVSGGTDNHLMLIDLRSKFPDLSGKVAEKELGKADITINKNMVPFDSRTPFQTSGIRVGTPAITSRGFVEKDMEFIVNLIDLVLANAAANLDLIAGKTEEGREAYEEVIASVKKQVRMKTNGMPLNRY